ncbi:MAG: hypothetical protein ACLSDQ_13760 [Adlercreutzia equolifaciens]
MPEGACAAPRLAARLQQRNKRRYHCSMPFRCEYSAALPAAGRRRAVRRQARGPRGGVRVHRRQDRADLARGLSPAQIADARSSEFEGPPPSTAG